MLFKDKQIRRYAVYVFFDADGIVDDYNCVFLKGLRSVTDKILVIVNGELTDEGRKKFETCADEVMVRPNEGYDITAYKLGLFHYGEEALLQYDEAIICNSTMYGPLYPFSAMFSEMAERDLDFWGITAFHKVDSDPFGTIKYHYLPQHIQSFFQVFRRDFMKTEDFLGWWKSMPEIHNYEEAIGAHEAVFTKEMEDRGYKWAVYCDPSPLEGFTYDPLRDFPRYLIETEKCPVMKKRSFYHEYGEAFSRSGGEATEEAFNFIKKHLSYDTDLIWRNLLRTENMADIKKRMHLNFILSSKIPAHKEGPKLKTALIAYIFYSDLAPAVMEYAANMPDGTDFFITVPNEKGLLAAKKAFRILEDRHRIEYRITGNRGRDVAPFLVGCSDIVMDYDLICKVHDKKAPQSFPQTIGLSWGHQCFECSLHNRTYVNNIIALFEDNERLGMLSPPVPLHGSYSPITGFAEWGGNYKITKELAGELGIRVPMDPDKEPVAPFGALFWFRPKSLARIFGRNFRYEDFPEEPVPIDNTVMHAIERLYPFAVQQEGFYSGWVMPDTFAAVQYDNWCYLNGGLEEAEASRTGGYFDYREFMERLKYS